MPERNTETGTGHGWDGLEEDELDDAVRDTVSRFADKLENGEIRDKMGAAWEGNLDHGDAPWLEQDNARNARDITASFQEAASGEDDQISDAAAANVAATLTNPLERFVQKLAAPENDLAAQQTGTVIDPDNFNELGRMAGNLMQDLMAKETGSVRGTLAEQLKEGDADGVSTTLANMRSSIGGMERGSENGLALGQMMGSFGRMAEMDRPDTAELFGASLDRGRMLSDRLAAELAGEEASRLDVAKAIEDGTDPDLVRATRDFVRDMPEGDRRRVEDALFMDLNASRPAAWTEGPLVNNPVMHNAYMMIHNATRP